MLACIIPLLCSFNKGYYFCCCNISISCDADALQGCTFIEKSISKHFFCWTPVGTAIGLESLRLVVCEVRYVCSRRKKGSTCSQLFHVFNKCFYSVFPLQGKPLFWQTTQCQKSDQKRQRVLFCLSQWQNDFCHSEVSKGWRQVQERLGIRCHMVSNQWEATENSAVSKSEVDLKAFSRINWFFHPSLWAGKKGKTEI